MMNKDWLHTKLGDIAKITCGIAATPEYVDESVGVPFLSARNVQDGKLDLSKFMYIPKELHIKLTKNTKPKKGDVLLTRVGAGIGKAAFVDIDFEFSVYVSLTLIQCKGMLDGNFLTFLLNTNYYQYLANRDQFAGGGVQNLNVQMVKGYPVSIPPLPEQIKIAEILSTWDNAINAVQKLLANSQQQKKSLMQQLLTGKKRFAGFEGEWESVHLSKIANVSIGLVTTMTKFYVNSGVPLIRNSDIKPNRIQKTNMVFLCKDFAFENKHRRLVKGDIVTVHTGEVGVSAIINDDLDGCLGFATLNTRPNLEKVTSEYLCWYFNSSVFINWSIATSTGDGRQNLNLKDFVKAKILLPSIEEQQKIAAILTTADQEIDNLRAQLNHLKQEKKALMQQLLTGKRRVHIEEAA